MHPAYFSIYLNLGILFLLERLFIRNADSGYKCLEVLLIIFLFATISLLSSRTAIVTSFGSVIFYSGIKLFKRKSKKKDFAILAVIIASAVIMQVSAMHFFNRFTQVTQAIQQSASPVPDTPVENHQATQSENNSTSAHYLIWKNAVGLIKQHLIFGVGIGDVHDELNKEFVKNNFKFGIEKDFNPHNQFLNTMVALGITGLILLLALFFLPAYVAWQQKNWICFFFLVIIFLNCLTESVLERQAGIIFFAFFFSLFAVQLKRA